MSKPIAKVAVFVLISLVLIAATSVGVRSWLDRPGTTANAQIQAHAVGGIQTNFNHVRSTSSELESLQTQAQPATGHQGGCHSSGQSSTQY